MEFSFVDLSDLAAALAAMLTAAVRPSLAHAPMFHTRAPTVGSGKSYLCELITTFATPQRGTPTTFPSGDEECRKMLLAEFLRAPAVVEFDNLTGDLVAHKSLYTVLTSEFMSGRILGVSKTATVGTRVLFLSSGNNVGPVQDMTRRCISVCLDPGCETPAARDRYEARDIDQSITSQKKVDQWFELKTKGLSIFAKAQIKQRWGTMQKVLSSQDRLQKIVADILLDMETRDRLKSGHGNAMLVSGSIYSACRFFQMFQKTDLAGKCAIVTSYKPSPADIKGEETGEGLTEKLRQYEVYRKMLAAHFDEPEETAMYKVELREGGEGAVHGRAGADEAPHRRGQHSSHR